MKNPNQRPSWNHSNDFEFGADWNVTDRPPTSEFDSFYLFQFLPQFIIYHVYCIIKKIISLF